jgi:hypothetical protein
MKLDWAEDRATVGTDLSADPVAETKGARLNAARLSSRPPSLRIGTKAINPSFHSYALCG